MSDRPAIPARDVVLIGAGIMSATLGTLLKELDPSLSVAMVEALADCGLESSDGWNNAGEYLIGQVLQSAEHQFAELKEFFPNARREDWQKAVAGQRVQTIAPHESAGWFKHEEGKLEFGTELVSSADQSLVALLGASPGASTAAFIALEVVQRCFAGRLTDDGWLPRLKAVIPTFGIDLNQDAEACRRSRAATAAVLRIENA